MPKVDILKDAGKLKSTDIVYMKRLEEQNLQRGIRVQGYRKANNRTAIGLGLLVIGIYAYTIYSVKQEKFLDDFEMPEKTIEKAA
ncbi:cytochrome c oxidase assembly factor 3, mitochondrial-like isoform X2 [Temnothorax curvispinosus]|nr:cytochrome c oxidase assembly factor 3, mitochondrial-like isoform X2 [Temnothorax curvispinosus]XP_024875862.1 cytochrome c oxidase assembly factor 3, mitochondrial-like isoform X2 [Temnothorax curvispinosus]